MILDNDKRRQFREEMVRAFDPVSLDLFLQDRLDVKLVDVVPPGNVFPMQCQLVILWAERDGRLRVLLQAIRLHHPNAVFKQFVDDMVKALTAAAPGAGQPQRPYVVNKRPMLNRTQFWQRLAALANGAGGARVLVVNGGVGKSYSRWPVSHMCDPTRKLAKLVCVDANTGGVVKVDGARLANLIAYRLWGSAIRSDDEDLAQQPRVTKDLASVLVQRLAALQERTWLIIDELNLVNLDDTALDLLRRLCQAIDGNECPQAWLFLIGLDPEKLGPRVGPYLSLDQVDRPGPKDIEDYLVWFANTVGKPQPPAALAPTVAALDEALTAAPDHAAWDSFHELLAQKCAGIDQGLVP